MADGSKFVLLFFLYFTQGLPYGIQTKLIPLLLRSSSVSLTKVSFSRILSFPWIFKVFIASFLNWFSTIWLWLMFSFCGMALCCGFPGLLGTDFTFVLLCGVFGLNIMAAGQDIAVDTQAIRILDSSDLGKGNIAQVVGYKTGTLIGGGLLVLLSQHTNWNAVFILLTIFYIICAIYAYKRHRETLQEQTFVGKISQSSNQMCCNDTNNSFEKTDTHDNVEANFVRNRDKTEGLNSGNLQQIAKECSCTQNSNSTAKNKDRTQVEVNKFSHKITRSTEANKCLKTHANSTETAQSEATTSQLRYIIKSKDFTWMVFYVFIYKLGEQGMVSIIPLYMLDSGFSVSNVGLVPGIVTQFFSIFGSTIGGWVASQSGCTCHDTVLLLKWISLARLLPMVVHCLNISTTPSFTNFLITECLLQLLAGIITTATFTLMMQSSKNITTSAQATHFSVLATVEVLGKLTMISLGGGVVESFGYLNYFVFCVILSAAVLPVLHCYKYSDRHID